MTFCYDAVSSIEHQPKLWESRQRVQKILADLKACSRTRNLEKGKEVHAEAVQNGHDSNVYVNNALVNMYCKCESMADACQTFDKMKIRNVVAWTTLMSGYANNGEGITALEVFVRMRCDGCLPDSWTFVAALKACSCLALNHRREECRDRGKEIHNLASEYKFDTEMIVQNTLVDMYAKCGSMADARQAFNCMNLRDVVSWTSLILGYADNGESMTALNMFTMMRSLDCIPNSWTFVAVLKACTCQQDGEKYRDWGKQIHCLVSEYGCDSETHVQSTLINMYAKFGSMEDALLVFDRMKQRNVISWTALIMGYADNGDGVTALDMFTRMRSQGCSPDSGTFIAALKACGLLGAFDFGKKLHAEIDTGNEIEAALVNCLVDFYGKCGSVVEAQKVFDLHPKTRNMITWNALLAAYSRTGNNKAVFDIFQWMQDAGFQPDDVTFTCLFVCCRHAGLVVKAEELFVAMSSYGITPTVEHYNCMVDILGRSNKICEAVALLQSIPSNFSSRQVAVAWMTVLGACCKWKNMKMGRVAFQYLVSYDDRNAADHLRMTRYAYEKKKKK